MLYKDFLTGHVPLGYQRDVILEDMRFSSLCFLTLFCWESDGEL